jgi:hypothetical protein
MNENKTIWRIEQLFLEMQSLWIKQAARKIEDSSNWTRQRNMMLEDLLICTLGKMGLSTIMEIRHYF